MKSFKPFTSFCIPCLIPVVLALTLATPVAEAAVITYSDSFEESTLDPFWTVIQQFGTVSLSTAQANSGVQSVAFTSTSGGQREMHLVHTFDSALKGDVSVYFYDTAPGSQTLYTQMVLQDSTDPSTSFSIGTMDFDAHCYAALVATSGNNFGPNQNCGVFPGFQTTNVARTAGWHRLGISVQPGSVSFSIDNNHVFTHAADMTFDTVNILMSGPGFRPNAVAFFDDFSIAASPVSVPEPAALLLLGTGLAGISCLRRRRLRSSCRDRTEQ